MTGLSFAWPWLFLLLPLPWLIWRFMPSAPNAQQYAIRVPFYKAMEEQFSQHKNEASRLKILIAVSLWILLVAASARPQKIGEPIDLPITGRSLMMAVDISESMLARDMEQSGRLLNRLQAVKEVAGKFIEQRVGDQVGLILFATEAHIQVPLTFDRKTVQVLLSESAIGLAGKKTAIGDAIGLAIKHLEKEQRDNRVLILLTDGQNTEGYIEPLKAADLAAQEGVKIYTIGVGAASRTIRGVFGSRHTVKSDLDEETLTAIAEKTGGKYFRAYDADSLQKVYQDLDLLEPVSEDSATYRPITELYFYPLLIAFVISVLLIVFRVLVDSYRRRK